MAHLPRGIDPALLISQIKNTMPYLYEDGVETTPLWAFPAAPLARSHEQADLAQLNHLDYFKLCVCAHYLTCATPVPTDVDNQIRLKLWPRQLPLETALEMARFVLETRGWDFTLVTRRVSHGAAGTPWEKEPLTGHLGEWFTIAAGAYCGLKQYSSKDAEAQRALLLDAITAEVNRHSEIFGSLWRAKDGLGALKTSASVAHNLGDLDRVMDMWKLDIGDPLRLRHYQLGVNPLDPDRKLRHLGRLWTAGELYKSMIEGSSMALENHRHFALRKPRALRRSPSLLTPTAPFFDEWGATVAREVTGEDLGEVVDALKHGMERMPKTFEYARALRSIYEAHPALGQARELKSGNQSHEAFERRWNDEALRHLDEIPGRA